MEQAQSMQKWLKSSYGITVSFDWLTACLEWIEQENKPGVQTVKGLQCQIFEQWLMSDLSEIGEKSLPMDLSTFHSTELTDIYPLQLISCFEIGSSLFSQLQKSESKKIDSDDSLDDKKPWMAKPSRMLLLCLTDGHTQVKAVEYQPIQVLNTLLPYGLKVLLRGPLKCRKGVILLTPGSIQILGGEVETSEEEYKPSEVLKQTMMKNRENSEGYARTEFSGAFLVQNKNFKSDKAIKKEKVMNNFTNTGSVDQKQELFMKQENSLVIKREITDSSSGMDESKRKSWPMKTIHVNEDEWEDDIDYSHLLEDELNFNDSEDMKEETDLTHIAQTSAAGRNLFSDSAHADELKGYSTLFNSKLSDSLNNLKGAQKNNEQITQGKDSLKRPFSVEETLGKCKQRIIDTSKSSTQVPRTLGQPTTTAITAGTTQVSSSYSKVFNNLLQNNKTAGQYNLQLRSIHQDKNLPQAVVQPIDHQLQHCKDLADELPYQYLSVIKTIRLPAKITVKAYISTLTEKLGSNNGLCWSLACRINDGTASIDVDLDDTVLTKLIGFTAKTSLEMRQQMKTQPHIKQELMQGLSQCQQKLINMSCLMELEITSLNRKPVVKELLELSADHVNQLLERLANQISS